MNDDRARRARDHFEQALHDFWLARYKAYRNNEDDGGVTFLDQYRLQWPNWRENEPGLPAPVYAAHLFYVEKYTDRDIGSDRVYKVPFRGEDVYVIRVTTDGDD